MNKLISLWASVVLILLLAPLSVSATEVFSKDFESGWGTWSADNGVWEVGTPSAGPAVCHGGSQCAGTILGGNYPNNTDSRLVSPSINLPSVSGSEELHLRFWQWFSYTYSDSGSVQISVYDSGAGSWSAWSSIGNLIANESGAWSIMDVDLNDYAGERVRIAFSHTADNAFNSTGWYIDDIKIVKKQPGFTGDFESGWGDWSADRGIWEVGTPSAGPAACHGGSQCAGTVLGGNYPNNTDSRLVSPSIVLPSVSGSEELHLRFWQWFSYTNSDSGSVQMSVYNSSAGQWSAWSIIPGSTVNGSAVWSPKDLDLTGYAGERVRIAFYHTADNAFNSTGWYIDDIQITGVVPVSANPVIIGFGSGGGGWLEAINSTSPYSNVDWLKVNWSLYTGANGETRPAVCDVNGDGKYEFVIGLGTGGGGWLEVQDDAGSGYSNLAWINVNWGSYNSANGETFPACGDIDNDGRDEVVVGLGNGGNGWVKIFDDALAGYAPVTTPAGNGWLQMGYSSYNSSNGEVRPAVGNLDQDAAEEIVLAVGQGGKGWAQLVDDASANFASLPAKNWIQLNWGSYNTANGAISPAVCDLNGDNKGEVLLSVGSGGGGWSQIFDSGNSFNPAAGTPYNNGWVKLGWGAYNSANGEVFPACGNLDADNKDELLLGIGTYPANGGWLEVRDDLGNGLNHVDWAKAHLSTYNSVDGQTRPAVGR